MLKEKSSEENAFRNMGSSGEGRQPSDNRANYHFSSDEIRVLRECNYESFFQRSLPISTACSALVYFAIQRGILQPNAAYGVAPKVLLGAIVGYFLGKISYQNKCAQKIMKLPNSKLADMLRSSKQGNLIYTTTATSGQELDEILIPNAVDIHSSEYEKWSNDTFDMDAESKPSISGLEDMNRPSLDNAMPHLETDLYTETSKHVITYDEIRKRNRDEFLKKSHDVRQN